MAPVTEVVLHVGAFKTGTSYVQRGLWLNRQGLAQHGVLYPGSTSATQASAVRAVVLAKGAAEGAGGPGGWDLWEALAAECRGWRGPVAVVSMEFLAGLPEAKRIRVVRSLAPCSVRVIYSARSLTETLPSQWQNSVRWGRSWSYEQYVEAVVHPSSGRGAARHFWRRHRWPRILSRWQRTAGVQRTSILTVPPPGSPSGLLWQRFLTALASPAESFESPPTSNESLSAEAAEVLRRLNVSAQGRGINSREGRKRVLTELRRASREPSLRTRRLVFPDQYRAWADVRTDQLLAGVQRTGTDVVGDLRDLRPAPTVRPGGVSQPSQLAEADLLPVVGFVLRGLGRSDQVVQTGDLDATIATLSRVAFGL
jgi:hypothetical protein